MAALRTWFYMHLLSFLNVCTLSSGSFVTMAFHCTQTASTQSKDLYESRRNILVKSSGGKSVRPYEPTMREDAVPIGVLTIFSEWLSGHGASDSYDVN
ncbi:hypothetical protein DFH08DRAFT_172647 [Mycena albidolilacea]|uniref:Secreted protein n=1 Tax=Mycena albidolilacea TaxID=1033008 RepID=A0AAD7F5H6_9AGAR|nr:hypothetical protein DFH08DRAFT_172647 [Mycena albidolilacea]